VACAAQSRIGGDRRDAEERGGNDSSTQSVGRSEPALSAVRARKLNRQRP
jgi:hypothetical protein